MDVRTRVKRPKRPLAIEDGEGACSSSAVSGSPMPPTAVMTAKKLRTQLGKAKGKDDAQSKKIEEPTKEKEALLAELSEYKKKSKKHSAKAKEDAAVHLEDSGSFYASSSSSLSSSCSSSSSSSSEDDRKKHKKSKKDKKRKKQRRKGKKEKTRREEDHFRHRAVTPHQVVKRYQKVLQHCQRGKNFIESFKAVGVDRNTIVASAPIAELAIASPEKYGELLKGHSRLQKIQTFVLQCANVIKDDPVVMAEVEDMKKAGKLLPFLRRK